MPFSFWLTNTPFTDLHVTNTDYLSVPNLPLGLLCTLRVIFNPNTIRKRRYRFACSIPCILLQELVSLRLARIPTANNLLLNRYSISRWSPYKGLPQISSHIHSKHCVRGRCHSRTVSEQQQENHISHFISFPFDQTACLNCTPILHSGINSTIRMPPFPPHFKKAYQ